MKLTNGEIFQTRGPLEALMKERLPVKISYGLATLAAKLNSQLEIIEKVRRGLIETYGAKDKDHPMRISVDPESETFPDFVKKMGELMSQSVEVVLEEVTLPDTLEVEPATLMALHKFVKVE